jgi:hypothetical protein
MDIFSMLRLAFFLAAKTWGFDGNPNLSAVHGESREPLKFYLF